MLSQNEARSACKCINKEEDTDTAAYKDADQHTCNKNNQTWMVVKIMKPLIHSHMIDDPLSKLEFAAPDLSSFTWADPNQKDKKMIKDDNKFELKNLAAEWMNE